jgi:ribonuclease HII
MKAGIDEAGKGCVIGPLVVAGVALDDDSEKLLEKLGVRDSKKLRHEVRIKLAERIRELAKTEVIKIEASKLDELMTFKTINEILKDCYADLILRLKPDIAYVDSPDVLPQRLSAELKERTGIKVVAEHKADEKYLLVAAASIIAKVEREKEIELLKERAGDFGSGYASDPKTREFLKRKINNGKIPNYVRKRWKTVSNLSQQTLDFFDDHS